MPESPRQRETQLLHKANAYVAAHPQLQRGVSLVRGVIADQGKERVSLSAAGVAFWFVIALFPALIATLMLLGLILDPHQLAQTIAEIEKASPKSFGGFILTQVQQAAQTRPSTLSLGFAISLVVVLWTTSSGYYNFARGVQSAYGLPPMTYIRARTRAFVGALIGMIVVGVLFVVAALVLAFANAQQGFWRDLIYVVLLLVSLALFTVMLAGLFRFATGKPEALTFYLPGALLGAVGTFAVFAGFGIYLSYSSSYEAIYGALAGAIIFLIVMYFSCYVILLGAVVNFQLAHHRVNA